MKLSDFNEILDDVLDKCRDIMNSKGVAYSGTDDKFGNFNRIATKLGLDRKKIWSVYFNKHTDAIDAFLREEYKDCEPIQGRIMDAINYLLLLYGMVEEEDTDPVVDISKKCEHIFNLNMQCTKCGAKLVDIEENINGI